MSQTTPLERLARRRARVRAKITGTAERPRLSVKITLSHISAQIIDDTTGRTLAAVSTVGSKQTGSLTDKAAWVGTEIAGKAKSAKIKHVVFDRGGRIYHGRLHALAEAARTAGLEF
ncbi:50S ribosomal protein L18 [Candidatus Saccharibacteria bacterium]|nr:50S ribosomal protein L18 [Candidatus Saccharibacteria bacterium]